MSIEGKYAYRFKYLKSEEWETLRLTCIAMDEGKCVVCSKYDPSNDAHHLFYRKSWKDTTVEDLQTLCRGCHKKVHEIGADILAKDLWDKYKFIFQAKSNNLCSICLTPKPSIPRLEITQTISLPCCDDCVSEFKSRCTKKESPWKTLDKLKKEKRHVSIRAFHAANLRAILAHGLDKHWEIRKFNGALKRAGIAIRAFIEKKQGVDTPKIVA